MSGTVVIYDKFLLTLYAQELLRDAHPAEFVAAAEFLMRCPTGRCFVFTIDPDEAIARKGTPGYRESGLDFREASGEISWQRFVAGDYDRSGCWTCSATSSGG